MKDVKTLTTASKGKRIVNGILWLIATSRNALVVVLASSIAFYAEQCGKMPFILTHAVRSGLPDIAVPPMHTTVAGVNGTVVEMNFTEMVC